MEAQPRYARWGAEGMLPTTQRAVGSDQKCRTVLAEVAIGARQGRPLSILSSRLRGPATAAEVGVTLLA